MIKSELTQCEAISRRTGIRCQKSAVMGKRMCRLHGGLEHVYRFFGVPTNTKTFKLENNISLDTYATKEEVEALIKKYMERDKNEMELALTKIMREL